MRTLTPAERRAFRAKAHHLHPVVSIGQHGLTPAVLHEIDVNLQAHELIKIRLFIDDRDEREALLARICADLDAAPVQHLGKILTLWRPAPLPEAPVVKARAKPSAGAAKKRAKPSAGTAKRRRPEPREAEPRSRTAPAGPRGKVAQAAAGSRGRGTPPRGGTAATIADEPRSRRRRASGEPADSRGDSRANTKAFARRDPRSGIRQDAAKRPPREAGSGSGKSRKRAAPATGGAKPRAAAVPGARRRRTPR